MGRKAHLLAPIRAASIIHVRTKQTCAGGDDPSRGFDKDLSARIRTESCLNKSSQNTLALLERTTSHGREAPTPEVEKYVPGGKVFHTVDRGSIGSQIFGNGGTGGALRSFARHGSTDQLKSHEKVAFEATADRRLLEECYSRVSSQRHPMHFPMLLEDHDACTCRCP